MTIETANASDATLHELASGQKVFGRYTLLKVLGRGGMGIVWLARDEELEREVALKFLPDPVIHDRTLLNDLKRETRRSLELTHKNIVRIYDFVQSETSACISMEYIDGDTLSNLRAEKEQRVFEPNEIAAWTSQLCDALDYAHKHAKIIHRDLKPANLMVNQKGDLKVSDFGIARSIGDSMSKLTVAGGTSGTLVYMSPQQLDGDQGTHLDDVYSLGATLYDLLTGKPPFYSGNIDRQVHERVPPSMTERRKEFDIEPRLVPAVWEETIAACLAKDPAKRPQSTLEVAKRLQLSSTEARSIGSFSSILQKRRVVLTAGVAFVLLVGLLGFYLTKHQSKPVRAATEQSPPPAVVIPEKSIAVLPFENLSAEKDDAFFADGIQDDVLTTLGKIKELKVTARPSVMAYRGAAVAGKLREIGQTLRVSHVLVGSVRRSANRVVVNVQLIDTRDDRQLWSERYEQNLNDALSLQGDLAVEIARELRATLTPAEKTVVATKPTENPEAYVVYLRARELEIRFDPSKEDYEAALKLYQQAIDLDPKFALARARWSRCLTFSTTGQDPAREPKALVEAEEALRLQPNLGEGRLALAHYYAWVTKDFNRALAELSRAEELIPSSAEVWTTRGMIYRRQDKLRERIAALQHAETLDPRDLTNLALLRRTFSSVRNWAEAARADDRINASVAEPNRTPWVSAYLKFHMTGEVDLLKKSIADRPDGTPPGDLGLISRARYEVAMLERDYAAAERSLRVSPAFGSGLDSKLMQEALLNVARGAGPAVVENALAAVHQEIEKLLADDTGSYLHCELGLVDAFRGRKEDAIREGRRALELAHDTIAKNDASAALALIYTRTGETGEAIKLIEKLLTVPAQLNDLSIFNMTQVDLKWRWVWDPLRSDPRFQKILAGPEPQTIY